MELQKTIEKDDLLTRMRIREVLLFSLIVMAAVLAQLPHEILADHGVNRDYLLGVLGCGIILGLFFYLKFFFFLAVVLLILGANLDQQISEYINISKIPLVLSLVAMVGIQLINYFVHLMPTGLEEKPKEKSPEGVRALFYAIEKSNLVYAQKVLQMNFDPNLQHENGYTALAYAAMKGNGRLVELLLNHGADPTVTTKDGDTPVELALRLGHADVADILKAARQAMQSGAAAPEPKPA
jgi:ankyrin repeat protein